MKHLPFAPVHSYKHSHTHSKSHTRQKQIYERTHSSVLTEINKKINVLMPRMNTVDHRWHRLSVIIFPLNCASRSPRDILSKTIYAQNDLIDVRKLNKSQVKALQSFNSRHHPISFQIPAFSPLNLSNLDTSPKPSLDEFNLPAPWSKFFFLE